MSIQSDLFGEPTVADEPPADRLIPTPDSLRVLAMPCGFLNSRNAPCRRQASRPVMIDGLPLVCRGATMLHCEPDCFRSNHTARQSYDEDDEREVAEHFTYLVADFAQGLARVHHRARIANQQCSGGEADGA